MQCSCLLSRSWPRRAIEDMFEAFRFYGALEAQDLDAPAVPAARLAVLRIVLRVISVRLKIVGLRRFPVDPLRARCQPPPQPSDRYRAAPRPGQNPPTRSPTPADRGGTPPVTRAPGPRSGSGRLGSHRAFHKREIIKGSVLSCGNIEATVVLSPRPPTRIR